jgi:hypothetical protein
MTTEPPTADPDRPCPHDQFEASVEVSRLTADDIDPTVVGYRADIRVRCAACGEQFRWTGLPLGVSPAHPTGSLDETVLSAPLRPAGADPDFGLGLPGVGVEIQTDEPAPEHQNPNP